MSFNFKLLSKLRLLTGKIMLLVILATALFSTHYLGVFDNKQITKICGYSISSFAFTPDKCVGDTNRFAITRKFATGKNYQPDSLKLVSGNKSIVAGLSDYMSMAVVQTKDGQTVADGTEVEFINSEGKKQTAKTLGGVANIIGKAPKMAGRLITTAHVGYITTIGNLLRVLPNEPVSMPLKAIGTISEVKEDQQLWIETTRIHDQFENTLSDGTSLKFTGIDNRGRRFIFNSKLINGMASSKLILRKISEGIKIKAHIKDIVSSPVNLEIKSVEIAPVLNARVNIYHGTVDLDLGPFKHKDGGYVEDGMEVSLQIKQGEILKTLTMNGKAKFHFTYPHEEFEATIDVMAKDHLWKLNLSYNSELDRQYSLNIRQK